MKEKITKRAQVNQGQKPEEEMLAEYDFSKGVRGKHARRFAEGANVVVLSPEVAAAFPTSEAVNEALLKYYVRTGPAR